MTPNFHDFLNLPVKYNPDKYVYPLISSSYANTKIQGNVNRYNHKTYEATTTVKPTASPTYYTTKQSFYYNPKETYTTQKQIKTSHATTTTSTTTQPTTAKLVANLLNSAMNHPYQTTEENYDDYDFFTTKSPIKTTDKSTIQKITTTHRPYSIFDELFGDYEEPKPIKTPSLFGNLGNFGEKIKNDKDSIPSASITKPETQTSSSTTTHNSHGMPATNYNNKDEYDYDDDYYNTELEEKKTSTSPQTVTPGVIKTSTSIVTESSISVSKGTTEKVQAVYSNFHQNNYNQPLFEKQNVTKNETKAKTERPDLITFTHNSDSYEDYEVSEEKTKSTSPISITETPPSMRVTSMPLGENHPVGIKMPPIIAMTHHNIKEQLSNEKVDMKLPGKKENASYAVEEVEEEKDQTFFSNSFRPMYTPQNVQKQPELDENGEVKEKLHFTGTGQTNSNYSWTVPTQNNYDTYSSYDPVAIKNMYNQEIQSNYSWKVPETTTHKKYIPEQKYVPDHSGIKYSPPKTNAVYKPVPEFNLQQVSSGYSIGQPIGSMGQPVRSVGKPIGSVEQPIGKPSSSYSQGQVFNVGLGTNFNGGTTKLRVPQNNNYQFMQIGTNYNMTVVPEGGASISIQPLRGTEASLSIGSPTGEVKTVPGQVMDEKLDIKDEELRKKPSINKIVFPEDNKQIYQSSPNPNREILSLYSKPIFHQLPADLTPPSEQDRKPQIPVERPIRPSRPPWDPRPGHFNYQGKPEYARPPRPPMKPDIFKRIDGLPNILPQFRPNAKVGNGHYHDNIPINPGYMQRQPLLERPSNRPIGFFEKLHPPPPPKRILELRKPVTLSQHLMKNPMEMPKHKVGDMIQSNTQKPNQNFKNDQYNFQKPPTVPVNRRNGEDESEIATLQMLHAKQADKLNTIKPNVPPPFKINFKEPSTTEKPLYVVYPVNTSPLKLDVLDNEKETVVIGQRVGENPLPPSKINEDNLPLEKIPSYGDNQQRQNPILRPKDRNDAPILKTKPTTYPIKSDFPYPLERPDATNIFGQNKGTDYPKKYPGYQDGNQWGVDTESRIVSGNKITYGNNEPISATLKTYTASPIAIAYTPTEPSDIRYSLPNIASSVIPEIRNDNKLGEIINGKNKVHQPGVVSGTNTGSGSEFTVSAVMHTHQQNNNNMMLGTTVRRGDKLENHKQESPSIIEPEYPAKLEFQAPFQASVNIGQNNGWSVIREKAKDNIDRSDNDVTTLLPSETTTEFDIENFKPQMFGGFKPIFDFPEDKQEKEHHNDDSLDLSDE